MAKESASLIASCLSFDECQRKNQMKNDEKKKRNKTATKRRSRKRNRYANSVYLLNVFFNLNNTDFTNQKY